jgi:DNA-binding LacI/PurR family transcriptional regulator
MTRVTAITAKQVAERTGVSISTVGRALADDPRISVETKAIVRKAADSLGYIESSAARIMRGGSSKLVGLMLPNVRNDFYSMIAEALSKCCDDQGYQLALSLADNPESEVRHLKELASAHVAGIVIVPTSAPGRETKALLRRFPHVQLLRRIPAWQSPWFGIDDEECVRLGTAHLLELGHRRIAYVGGSIDFSTGAARLRGFRRAIREAGIKPQNAVEALGQPTIEFGVEALGSILRQSKRPSALITGSVQITQSALEVLHRLRISVPEDMSIVGFGDAPGFDWWGPGLTTMRMPVQELATACGLWFLNHLKAKANLEPGYASAAQAEFVLRHSTAAVAKRVGKTEA